MTAPAAAPDRARVEPEPPTPSRGGFRVPWGRPDRDFTAQLQELAKDLVTLEVNTIIKSNMTAERMPNVPNALLDIAREYVRVFKTLRADVKPVFEHDRGAGEWHRVPVSRVPLETADFDFFDLPDRVTFGDLFERLRWAAKNARHTLSRLSEEDQYLLTRIESNSDTLRVLVERYPGLVREGVEVAAIRAERDLKILEPPITARDLLIVRKIWEIGVDPVVAQSSIQLDGDVVTRISRQIAGDPDRASQILMIHQQGIQTAIGNWKAIIEAASAVVSGLLGRATTGSR